MKKKTENSGKMLDDTIEQTGLRSKQEMHLEGSVELSSLSERIQSENGYELSQ